MAVLGIDYGGRRIGIAVSESEVVATPHSVIANAGDVVGALARLGERLEVQRYVVGVARRARTTAGGEKFGRFAEALRQRTCKTVVLWDETLSTVEAAERLRESAGSSHRRSREQIDMYAAAVILQSYLDAQNRREP